ncbi:antibiotic biosynthesis monooxygenase family protein [Actinokineospora globicatena]|uniref:antibiotic biosynthesis monooxygenase family protein n=1 Tax=Actinokineospora globicatena TaxID=103729 RepID=UPI0020A4710B|nr:antibiotic biosynthesis monooxygenase [Actinokineospora globicatena]MCP2306374.1 Heme-degrading monooxygenase HmoA [Actinokineospora globicatena]GLW81801.1 antibiotic biosynthesis monooxygenase [Actinokineospora globicatena]GLW88595.1 antibiotic biosynthesis monooxygenase [Actinokineospora globicatena]
MELTTTPEPPYYAVIFTSILGPDDEGYHEAAERMFELVRAAPGFLGVDSARGEDRVGVTVSYFRDEVAIAEWREEPEHVVTRAEGRGRWYDAFEVRVARVERAYGSR